MPLTLFEIASKYIWDLDLSWPRDVTGHVTILMPQVLFRIGALL